MNGPRILVASICLTMFLPLARVYAGAPAATLEIQGDPVQPANAPVLLELAVRNTGPAPISYWCAGPGDYPDATDFIATISRTDRPGIPGRSPLSNGQQPDGLGRAVQIAPGRTLRFPAAVRPLLPPGEYDIAVACDRAGRMQDGVVKVVTWPAMQSARAFHLSVREDPQLLAARDASIVAKVRDHDPFARHVSSTWPRRPVREALIKDLTGDDVVAAGRAAEGLWGDGLPPGIDLPLIARVILKHLDPPKDGTCDIGLMTKLIRAGDPMGVGAAPVRDAVAKLATARIDGPVHERAMAALDLFNRTPPSLTVRPAGDSMREGGSDFLAALIGLSRSADPGERKIAYRRLADFPGEPAAIGAVRGGLLDDDADCRKQAQATLALIERPSTTQPGAGP
ncbi:MAG TPA: hypothetical protein VGI81_03390 [Tepidisphaeraceae bacterium]|jgi:hypothetical protein